MHHKLFQLPFEAFTSTGGLGSICLPLGVVSFMNIRNKQVAPSKLLHTFKKKEINISER